MIQVADGSIMKNSTVVLTPVRTPLEIFGSLLKLWCPSRGLGNYANSAALFSDLFPSLSNQALFTCNTIAGSNNVTLSSVANLSSFRISINSVDRFVITASGAVNVIDSSWMNEGVYPTTLSGVTLSSKVILQANDKSGNGNNLTTLATNAPTLLYNKRRLTIVGTSLNTFMNMPNNLLNNQTKFMFGVKSIFSIIGSSILTIKNNANTRNRFSISLQTSGGKNSITILWDNNAIQTGVNYEIPTTNSFYLVVFVDFTSNRVYVQFNNSYAEIFAPYTNAIDNNNAAFSRIMGDGATSTAFYMIDPVMAVGSGLTKANFYELIDYYKYL